MLIDLNGCYLWKIINNDHSIYLIEFNKIKKDVIFFVIKMNNENQNGSGPP